MTSPLSGSLAKTIGKALYGTFLSATLTRGSTVYQCRAIFTKWGKYLGPAFVAGSSDYTILVLASTIAIEPAAGDIINLQGTTAIVIPNGSVPAVSRDPAIATYTLLCKPQDIDAGSGTGTVSADYPRTISIARPASSGTPGGLKEYQGETKAGETAVSSGIVCSILIASAGRTKLGEGLPDESAKVQWVIQIPTNGIIVLPMIWEGDRIYDDLGRRFEVSAYEPSALGAKIAAVRLRGAG